MRTPEGRLLNATLSGLGNLKLGQLDADALDLRLSGSGDASVHARRALTAALAGSGDLSYAGEPSVKSSISGSGSLKRQRTP